MLLFRNCHFYFVSEKLPRPLPFSKSFRSTLLRWHLRRLRRKCSPQKLQLILVELSRQLQKRERRKIALLSLKCSSNRPSFQSVTANSDQLRPATPPADAAEDLAQNSPSTQSLRTTPGDMELALESFECLELALQDAAAASHLPPPSSFGRTNTHHRRMSSQWLQNCCLDRLPIAQTVSGDDDGVEVEDSDPLWQCFKDCVLKEQEMDPPPQPHCSVSVMHLDVALIVYERALDRLINCPIVEAGPSSSSPSMSEPVMQAPMVKPQRQEMERQEMEEQEIGEKSRDPNSITRPYQSNVDWNCRCCTQRLRTFDECTFLKKQETTTMPTNL